jgi:hypothetical protein
MATGLQLFASKNEVGWLVSGYELKCLICLPKAGPLHGRKNELDVSRLKFLARPEVLKEVSSEISISSSSVISSVDLCLCWEWLEGTAM